MRQLKRNIAGYTDEQGRFRPIRKPSFVGTPKRKATRKDVKKYSRAKAGDLGKRRQALAREDVFDREIRLEKERKAKDAKAKERLMRQIERESLGDQDAAGKGKTLVEFVRSAGGIRPTYKYGGKKYRGHKESYDFGELEPFTYKQSGKRGLVSDKAKKTLDGMFQAARESGYSVGDPWDLLNAMDDELKGGKVTYGSYGYLDYRDNPKRKRVKSAVRAAKAAISIFDNDLDLDVDAADLRRLQAVNRKLVSRRKNGKLKRNPIGWFKGVEPVTPEAIKKFYRQLAAKYHPDKGGDTRTMQEINADYDKAMKIAISGEGNEARAKAETTAIKPLREAIEFAVTLPDDVKVVIRGLWLWLEGNTYKAKDQIKSFTSSDGNRFKWASQKKAWFFAAVPSKNRRGEMSFAEIESLYGREDVKDRKSRRALNPGDPITAFSALTGGIASALQIKEMLNRPKRKAQVKRKTNGKTAAKPKARRSNPATAANKHNEREFKLDIAAIEGGNYRKARTAQMHGRLAGYSKREVETQIENAKLKARLKAKLNPASLATLNKQIKAIEKRLAGNDFESTKSGDWAKVALELAKLQKRQLLANRSKKKTNPKIPRSRTFEKFQGRPVTKAVARPASAHAPTKLAQLGDLIELRLTGGRILKPNPQKYKLTAANGKLWIVGGRIAKPNPKAKANEINPLGEITHVVYGTRKPHHGDHKYTHYIHKLGEESGKRPLLCADRDGYAVVRGGNYKIEARGIVD
jgi:hypothetical protein